MRPPTTVSEVRRFLGMVNQLGNFVPNLADLTKPLRVTLQTQSLGLGRTPAAAYTQIKEVLIVLLINS